MNEHTSKINKAIRISKPSLKMIFAEAFDKNSIVFIICITILCSNDYRSNHRL